jgi:ABC-2 type transport system permease protein
VSGRELVALVRLEFSELMRSRWIVCSTGVYTVLAAVLVLAGMRESVVLGFGGMSRVMLSFSHVLLMVLPLLALTASVQVVNRARDDGTMELLFSQPRSRTGYLFAVSATRYLLLIAPLAALLLTMGVLAHVWFGENIPWSMMVRTIAVSAMLLWAFTGVGIAISVYARHQALAVTWGMLTWLVSIALLDLALIGLLLQWRVDARSLFVLASINPVQAARLALLSGIETDLGVLGPVGFFLAHRVGTSTLLALGLLWPFVVGTGAWLLAWRRFNKHDLL